MNVTLPNGTVISDVPDSATKDQVMQMAIKNNLAKPEDFGMKADSFQPNIRPEIKAPANLPYGMSQSDIAVVNKNIQRQNEFERSFIGDEARQQMRKEEEQRGTLSAIGEGIKHVGKGFYAGTLQSPDWLPKPIQDILDYRLGGDNTKSREEAGKDIKEYMAKEAERYGVTAGMHPVATAVGETLPYLATGEIGGRVIGSLSGLASPIAKEIGLQALTKIKPVAAERIRNKPTITTDFDRRIAEATKAVATGAAEGAAQYDSSAGEGAAVSTLGALAGTFGPLKILDKVENVRDPYSKQLVNEMHKEGFSLTPGVRTGNRRMQTEEAGLRNSDVLGDYFYQKVTRPNERKMTEMAGEAIGLSGKNKDSFSDVELSNHLQNLSNEYKGLEANTTGKFGSKQVQQIGTVLKDLQPTAHRNTAPLDKQRYQTVKSITDTMTQEISTPRRGAGGRFEGYQYDGSQYQAMRQRIQQEMSQAYNNGDKRLGDSLRTVQTALDESITNGMNKATASQWKDLNERYAMTNLLLENGLTPTGKVNPMGITSAVMAENEATRTLTSKGGRIKQFQKMAKYNDILNDVEGGSLTGLGGADFAANRDITKLPFRYQLPLYARMTGAYRLSQLPTMGMGPTAGMKLGRAIGASEPLGKVMDAGQQSFESLMDTLLGR